MLQVHELEELKTRAEQAAARLTQQQLTVLELRTALEKQKSESTELLQEMKSLEQQNGVLQQQLQTLAEKKVCLCQADDYNQASWLVYGLPLLLKHSSFVGSYPPSHR